MRITYRTVRVLITIGSRTRASNREIAAPPGIADQGQVSKLLARLRAPRAWFATTGVGPAKGAPNAWALTRSGAREVERAIRVQTASRPELSPAR